MSADNPFVESALDIIRGDRDISEPRLVKLLADCEPELSPFNLECAACEGLRMAPAYFAEEAARAAREAVREKAAAEGQRKLRLLEERGITFVDGRAFKAGDPISTSELDEMLETAEAGECHDGRAR
jgi:hypothetical protein